MIDTSVNITLRGGGFSQESVRQLFADLEDALSQPPGFTGRLQLDFGDWGPNIGRIAITMSEIGWRGYVLPKGFMSDGASVPRPLWWFLPPWGDRATIAALFHDYLSEAVIAGVPLPGAETRTDCDRLFRECLIDLGVSSWRAWTCWAGVRAFSILTRA